MRINYDIIKSLLQAKDHTLLRRYAVWLKLKYIYVRGKYYNYSLSKLSIQLGISRQATKKYITFFIDNNWCKVVGNHIYFISNEEFKQFYKSESKYAIYVNKDLSINEIIKELRYSALIIKQAQFNYAKEILDNLANPINNKVYQSAKRKVKKLKCKTSDAVSNIKENLMISYKSLSGLIGASKSTIKRLIDTKVDEGRANVFKGKRMLLYKNVKTEFAVGNCQFQHKTKVYYQEPNSYAFF